MNLNDYIRFIQNFDYKEAVYKLKTYILTVSLKKELDEIYTEIDLGHFDEALFLISSIRYRYGELPATVRAEVWVRRMKSIGR